MTRRQMDRFALLVLGLSLAAGSAPAAANLEPLLNKIKTVGREGKGNDQAQQAWRELVKAGPDGLTAILAGFAGADATAANWLRSAVDAIAERELNAGRPLPVDRLEAFVLGAKNPPAGRRLAYEWLTRVDKTAPARLLPKLADDPSGELRRDAVAVLIDGAQQVLDKGDRPAAAAAFARALFSARDKDQVDAIAGKLRTLGVHVDLAAQYGYVRKWHLAAPFDNTKESGFDRVYPPETGVDLKATYPGKGDAAVKWVEHSTNDPGGVVDLNKALGKHKGAVAYAFTAVESDAERPVQVRVGCINGVKIFLNGKELFRREEYHHGMDHDQYVGVGVLKKGRNEILLKICQNEQSEEWAQNWMFQARLCDDLGGAVPVTLTGDKVTR